MKIAGYILTKTVPESSSQHLAFFILTQMAISFNYLSRMELIK